MRSPSAIARSYSSQSSWIRSLTSQASQTCIGQPRGYLRERRAPITGQGLDRSRSARLDTGERSGSQLALICARHGGRLDCRPSTDRLLVVEVATARTAGEDRQQTSRHSGGKKFVSFVERAESKLGHLGGGAVVVAACSGEIDDTWNKNIRLSTCPVLPGCSRHTSALRPQRRDRVLLSLRVDMRRPGTRPLRRHRQAVPIPACTSDRPAGRFHRRP